MHKARQCRCCVSVSGRHEGDDLEQLAHLGRRGQTVYHIAHGQIARLVIDRHALHQLDQSAVQQEARLGSETNAVQSTGIGGKRVESDDTKFSLSNKGEWQDKFADRMQKPQAVNHIVERQGKPLDPKVAAMLRDAAGDQKQLIERAANVFGPQAKTSDTFVALLSKYGQMQQQLDQLEVQVGSKAVKPKRH